MKTAPIILSTLLLMLLLFSFNARLNNHQNHINYNDSIYHYKDSVHDENLMQLLRVVNDSIIVKPIIKK